MAKSEAVKIMTPLLFTGQLESAGPLLMGKKITTLSDEGESPAAHDQRCWQERMHVDNNGQVFIPAIALKRTLASTARYLSERIPGKGQATFTKHFTSGILVLTDLMVGISAKDVRGVTINVPAQPQKPKGPRVDRKFPVIPQWQASFEIMVNDPILISWPKKIEQYLHFSGKFIGLLSMRVGNGGQHGRYSVKNVKYEKVKL